MERRLYFMLQVAQQHVRQQVDRECIARTGLSSAQAGLLFYVAKHPGCQLKDAAEGLSLKNAAMTGLVARTEKTGCVRRLASSQDGRAGALELTAKGQRKLAEVQRLNAQLAEVLQAGFTDDDLDIVLRFLRHVAGTALSSEAQ